MSIDSKKESIFIRNINESDAKKLYEFLKNLDENTKTYFHPHPFDMKTILNICKSKKDHYFVMFLKNNLIGYSFLRLFSYEIPSYGIIIKKEYTNKGYGTILTKWTIEKAKNLGFKKVILKTYIENISAQKVYEKLGFNIVGKTKDKKQYKMEIIL
jgi:RimJ/RimL family protein N-acetyltransferase